VRLSEKSLASFFFPDICARLRGPTLTVAGESDVSRVATRFFLNLYATRTKKINQLLQLLTKIFNFVIIARLVTALNNTLYRDLLAKDKL
jgi:hypothetical protein